MGGLHAEQFVVHDLYPGYPVQFGPHMFRRPEGRVEQTVAAFDHLPTPAVQRRVHQYIRAGGHEQIRAVPQAHRIDQIALHMENRALFEAGAHLVHAHHADIGARVHRPRRQLGMERQMRAPRLVHDQRFATCVTDPRDTFDIRAGAVGTGTDDQRARGVGIFLPGRAYLLRRRGMGEMPFGIPAGVIQRGSTPEKISPATIDL